MDRKLPIENEELVRGIREKPGRLVRGEHLHRVGIEGHHHDRPARLRLRRLGLVDDGAMPEMEAVEHADGKVERTGEAAQFRDVGEHLHDSVQRCDPRKRPQAPRSRETSGRLNILAMTTAGSRA